MSLREEIKAEMRSELEDELRSEIKDEMLDNDDIKQEAVQELLDRHRGYLEREAKDQLKEELRDELTDELRDELEADIREELKAEIREELEAEMEAKLRFHLCKKNTTKYKYRLFKDQHEEFVLARIDRRKAQSPKGQWALFDLDTGLFIGFDDVAGIAEWTQLAEL